MSAMSEKLQATSALDDPALLVHPDATLHQFSIRITAPWEKKHGARASLTSISLSGVTERCCISL